MPTRFLLPLWTGENGFPSPEERREMCLRHAMEGREKIQKAIKKGYIWLVGPGAGDHGGTIKVPIEEHLDAGEGNTPRFRISYRHPDYGCLIELNEYNYLWHWASDKATALESARRQRMHHAYMAIRRKRRSMDALQTEIDELSRDMEETKRLLNKP